ncbi:MAG: peptidylprolyl isomerase [Gammaproteobacteria bacterium]|nr:peptidylprolyl isomerase [Gammaproteobacteria bacterium]
MQISKNTVVSIHYRLSDEHGEIENSHNASPMAYLHGQNNILPSLEKALEGKTKGEQLSITLAPEDAYGLRNPQSQQRVPIKHLVTKGKLTPGKAVKVNTQQGVINATVVKVGKFNVDLDTNHPLAGKQLTFNIEIVDVRGASEEELSHGHAHGVGGHAH